ncbi:hypothetical protein J5J83_19835 [Azoarcus sp. L1K30]|uniref:hypothetical protein n=1 Tax=Azoarcus sp. L1K30 TaxID=2820277 RepID=UPI001B818448|nr:hypothetical protein [Azoarcus sp. L1K30]MBR0568379.1 hypothetical protein [Azoarcus sp. L1K30]
MEATEAPSSTLRQPLHRRWVQKIFAELQGSYGSRFLDMWRSGQALPDGTDAGIENAMRQWGEKLSGFEDQPERIRRVLDALPLHPPTLPEFVALCRQQQAEQRTALPPPRVPREVAKARAEQLARTAKRIAAQPTDGLAWARKQPTRMAVAGSAWERNIVELAEEGNCAFVEILAGHIADGTISSPRAAEAVRRHRSAA